MTHLIPACMSRAGFTEDSEIPGAVHYWGNELVRSLSVDPSKRRQGRSRKEAS